jgi:hypothetical protein
MVIVEVQLPGDPFEALFAFNDESAILNQPSAFLFP